MDIRLNEYVSIREIQRQTGLDRGSIRSALAADSTIPRIKIGTRIRYHAPSVVESMKRAAQIA